MPPITGPGTMEQPKPIGVSMQMPGANTLPMGGSAVMPGAPAPGTTTSPAGIIGYNAQGGVIPQSRPGFGSNDPTLNSAVDYANMARSASPTPGLERANDLGASLGKLQEARQQQYAGVNSPGAAGADYQPSAPVAAGNPSFYGR